MEKGKEIISYDYKTIRVRRQIETVATDAYEALGWELVGSSVFEGGIFHVVLSFKRDRRISNKEELLKLQAKADKLLINIETLQRKKRNAGTTPAIATGIVGALALGGGMSIVIELAGTVGWMIGGIALGVVGLGICGLAWLIYNKVKNGQEAKIAPMLEEEYNKLADLCEEAKRAK